MKKAKYIFLIAVAMMTLAGCGSNTGHKTPVLDPIKVKVGTARVLQTDQTIQVSGRIEAGNSANISTRMMGNVSQVLVKPGQQVRKGQLLIALASADLQAKKAQVQASIIQAESGFSNAEKDLQRFRTLHGRGSATDKELENMTTRYEVAKAGLEAAHQMEKEVQAQFAYTNLRAPFDGVVANTFVKVGDIAHPGMPLATIEGNSNFEASVLVPESQIPMIQVGAKASVVVKSTGTTIHGLVKEVSPSAKNTGGQFLVKIDLEDADDVLPGMFVNADIAISQSQTVETSPMIRESALIRNGQLTGIYAMGDNQTAILRWVRTGKSENGEVEVLSGLSEGEQYIVDANGKLFNGAKVTTQPVAER